MRSRVEAFKKDETEKKFKVRAKEMEAEREANQQGESAAEEARKNMAEVQALKDAQKLR